ncbi:MAG: hypothetical protein J07HQW2_00439 [Haloquadratum walsbyi J07HQW2]|uniref:Uncharacterized protein n=1 Tax=Haloquadratum walsbyi J07HQW2 TaxID=1238425 RepID=U1NAY4_9EURY|nr:MAG: hypothetical protein J07HQW2_00439 [Haloquadratum walsbyi J07HQW2]
MYDTWEAQHRAIDATIKEEADIFAFLRCGSGETPLGIWWLVKQTLEYDSLRFLALGIDFQKARDAAFRVLFEQLPGEQTGSVTSSYNGPESSPTIADYTRQDHKLTFTNDSIIKLGSSDRWNRYVRSGMVRVAYGRMKSVITAMIYTFSSKYSVRDCVALVVLRHSYGLSLETARTPISTLSNVTRMPTETH